MLLTTFWLRWKSGSWDGLGQPWPYFLIACAILPLLLFKDAVNDEWLREPATPNRAQADEAAAPAEGAAGSNSR